MFANLLDAFFVKASTPDFWRGVIYAVAGTYAVAHPDLANYAVSGAVALSGVLHIALSKNNKP